MNRSPISSLSKVCVQAILNTRGEDAPVALALDPLMRRLQLGRFSRLFGGLRRRLEFHHVEHFRVHAAEGRVLMRPGCWVEPASFHEAGGWRGYSGAGARLRRAAS